MSGTITLNSKDVKSYFSTFSSYSQAIQYIKKQAHAIKLSKLPNRGYKAVYKIFHRL